MPLKSGVPASTLAAAIAERQADIERLSANAAQLEEPIGHRLAVMPTWVRQQLEDVAGLLSATPERTKTAFQRLRLRVTMTPQQGADGLRRWYRADVVSSLPQLLGSSNIGHRDSSTVDRLDLQTAGSRTCGFSIDLRANHPRAGWRKRVRTGGQDAPSRASVARVRHRAEIVSLIGSI
jgi:hypothetical protein